MNWAVRKWSDYFKSLNFQQMKAVVHNFNEHNTDTGLIIDRSRAVSSVIVEVAVY